MLRKKLFVQMLLIGFLCFCAANPSPAQKTAAAGNALAKFEKSIEQGDYAAVERDLLNYLIQNPNDPQGFELLGRMRFNQNRLSEAKSLYQKVLTLDPNLIPAKIDLAVINFRTGNSAAALFALNEIAEKDVSDDALRLKLARTFAQVGDCRKALETVEKLSLKIKNGDALPLRAQCYLETGESAQKINSLLPSANSLIRQNPAVSVKFADVLIGGAMFKEAADVLRAVVKTFPQKTDALILLAKAEIYLKEFESARIHLARASKIKPSPELFFVQGLLESEQGKAEESLELLEKALAAEPDSTVFLRQYVISAIRANENGKAVRAAEKLLQLNPNEPDFIYLHGAAALQNNNLKAAETSLTKFFGIRPRDPRGCVALGLVFAAQPDKLDTARRQMEKCIEINPGNTEAKYQLGLSYKAQGDTGKAIEYFEATVSDAPNYGAALRDLGTVYLQSGAEVKARGVLEKAVSLLPDDAETHFQLSRLYNLTGATELARKHLEIFQKLKTPKKDGM